MQAPMNPKKIAGELGLASSQALTPKMNGGPTKNRTWISPLGKGRFIH